MSLADPTNQARNRNRTDKKLKVRLTNAEKGVKRIMRAIPRKSRSKTSIRNNAKIFEYDYDPELLAQFIQREIDRNLETEREALHPNHWYSEEIERPYRAGTVEEVNHFDKLVSAALIGGLLFQKVKRFFAPQVPTVQQVLASEPYRTALNRIQVDNYRRLKGLSDKTSNQVYDRINALLESGASPRGIAEDISARFNIARSDAKRISATEVNQAYNNAKLNATQILEEETGLRAGVIHISALLPTTRGHHAARHSKTYTVEDQQAWWAEGSNKINCHCSVESVLVDSKGRLINPERQEAIKEQGDNFFND